MTASTSPAPRFPRAAGVLVIAWLALALVAGGTGFLVRLPLPGPQLIFLGLFAATLVAVPVVPALGAWVMSLPLVLFPTFVVPVFLASHVIIFRRLRGATHGA